MKKTAYPPELIVMLTWHDYTVPDAAQIFEQCRHSKARYWGFKEHPLPVEQMRALYTRMKACGKTTCLEVVAYTEAEGLAGARTAVECGCDVLMGTKYAESIHDYCRRHRLRYMPFVGRIAGRPSVLEGDIGQLVAEARQLVELGVDGIDRLGYRYTGDAVALNRAMVDAVDAPVCLAGSINSFQRLDEVKQAGPWAFTIGSAFFEHAFGSDFARQVDAVCDYMGQ